MRSNLAAEPRVHLPKSLVVGKGEKETGEREEGAEQICAAVEDMTAPLIRESVARERGKLQDVGQHREGEAKEKGKRHKHGMVGVNVLVPISSQRAGATRGARQVESKKHQRAGKHERYCS